MRGEPRLRALQAIVVLVLVTLTVRLFQLQIADSQAYAAQAARTLVRTVTLPATPGTILDADGLPLPSGAPVAAAGSAAAGSMERRGVPADRAKLPAARAVDERNPAGWADPVRQSLMTTYATELAGVPGLREFASDGPGRTPHLLRELLPVPGANVLTTLDSRLQRLTAAALEPGASAVILDPMTGRVRALCGVRLPEAREPAPDLAGSSPLDLATTYAAIANGGIVFRPLAAKALVRADGTVVRTITAPVQRRLPLSPSTLQRVRGGLASFVRTDPAFLGSDLRVLGRSGTRSGQSWSASYDARHVVVVVSPGAGEASRSARLIWDALSSTSAA